MTLFFATYSLYGLDAAAAVFIIGTVGVDILLRGRVAFIGVFCCVAVAASLYLSTWTYEMTDLMFLGGLAFLALFSLVLWLFHLLTVDLGIKA